MDFQDINILFSTDFNIDGILAIQQCWPCNTRFNYLEKPRRRHGLLMLTDYPALFELPGGESFKAVPGDILLLPKGSHYTITFLQPPDKVTQPLLINFRMTDNTGNELPLPAKVLRAGRDEGPMRALFHTAAQLYKNASPVRLKATVYELLGRLFPLSDLDELCIGYINHNFTDRFSIPQLAGKCGLSETAYRKRFKAATGTSPLQYINALKIEKARQMLSGIEDISIKEICDSLSFYSLPYFYKVFREHTGLTPMKYRALQLNASGDPPETRDSPQS